MTAKLIPLAGLLLLLSAPSVAAGAEAAVQAPAAPPPLQTAQTQPAPQQLAWQRVGAPATLES